MKYEALICFSFHRHKIITEKPSGMILGWQSEQRGRIFYSESLPVDVNISK